MPKAFFRKAFDRWIGHNRGRLAHPPTIKLQRMNYLELGFQGVTPKIKGIVSKNGTAFHICHADEVKDMLNDIDIAERRRSDGKYFCALCLEPIYYASRQELWEQHCFEPMLDWANAAFQPGQWLHLVMTDDGSSWAEITPRNHPRSGSVDLEFSGSWPVLLNPKTTDDIQCQAPHHHDSTRC